MCRRVDRLQDCQKSNSRIREHTDGNTAVPDHDRPERGNKSRKDNIMELHTAQVPASVSRNTQEKPDC